MLNKICTRTAKSAPWFVHYGCVPEPYSDENYVVTASILKPTQPPHIAGPLGVIANLLPGDKQHLDNFLLLIIWYPFIKNDIYKESYDT